MRKRSYVSPIYPTSPQEWAEMSKIEMPEPLSGKDGESGNAMEMPKMQDITEESAVNPDWGAVDMNDYPIESKNPAGGAELAKLGAHIAQLEGGLHLMKSARIGDRLRARRAQRRGGFSPVYQAPKMAPAATPPEERMPPGFGEMEELTEPQEPERVRLLRERLNAMPPTLTEEEQAYLDPPAARQGRMPWEEPPPPDPLDPMSEIADTSVSEGVSNVDELAAVDALMADQLPMPEEPSAPQEHPPGMFDIPARKMDPWQGDMTPGDWEKLWSGDPDYELADSAKPPPIQPETPERDMYGGAGRYATEEGMADERVANRPDLANPVVDYAAIDRAEQPMMRPEPSPPPSDQHEIVRRNMGWAPPAAPTQPEQPAQPTQPAQPGPAPSDSLAADYSIDLPKEEPPSRFASQIARAEAAGNQREVRRLRAMEQQGDALRQRLQARQEASPAGLSDAERNYLARRTAHESDPMAFTAQRGAKAQQLGRQNVQSQLSRARASQGLQFGETPQQQMLANKPPQLPKPVPTQGPKPDTLAKMQQAGQGLMRPTVPKKNPSFGRMI